MRTLAFPITEAIAGHVYLYEPTPALDEAWADLTLRFAGERKSLPYKDLAQAMRFVLGDFAAVQRGPDDTPTMIMAGQPLPPNHLVYLFREFEQSLAQRRGADVTNTLAPHLAGLTPRRIAVGDYLKELGPTGEPKPPRWVYDVITWHAVTLLAKQPIKLPNGATLRLRPDIDGNLLAWDDLLPGNGSTGEQAMHYLSVKAITLPGIPHLLLSIDAHISRLTHFLGNARHVWIAPSEDKFILTAGHFWDRASGNNFLTGTLPALVDSFSIDGIPTEFSSAMLVDKPNLIRARHSSTPNNHPVGSGPGRKFLDVVLTFATDVLSAANTQPLDLTDSKIRNVNRADTEHNDREPLTSTINQASLPIHLVGVYTDDSMRSRQAGAVASALGVTPDKLAEAQQSFADGRLTVEFLASPAIELLQPGASAARQDLADRIKAKIGPGKRGIVLAETSLQRAQKDGKAAHDPKPQLKQALARHGIVSQFLDMASTPRPDAIDFPADGGMQDLLRLAGLTGTTPGRVFDKPLEPQPVVLVGLHTRTQNKPACRTIGLAAMVTDGTNTPWKTLGYHTDAQGWNDYAAAVAAYHAADISPIDRAIPFGLRETKLGEYVQRALDQLLLRYPGLPFVIFVDGVGARSIWPGLSNASYGLNGSASLPHLGLNNAGKGQIALVRVSTNDDGELFQPVRDLGRISDKAHVPVSMKLFGLTTAKADVFYLVNRSRTDQAYDSHVRASHSKTRFEIANNPRTLRAAWHALTCTEFAILDRGGFTADMLAALTARLCGHTLAWDGRTSRPAPHHLARQTIEDHPLRTA